MHVENCAVVSMAVCYRHFCRNVLLLSLSVPHNGLIACRMCYNHSEHLDTFLIVESVSFLLLPDVSPINPSKTV